MMQKSFRKALPLIALTSMAMSVAFAETHPLPPKKLPHPITTDSVGINHGPTVWHHDTIRLPWGGIQIDSIAVSMPAHDSIVGWVVEGREMALLDSADRYRTLTDNDFRRIAKEMGVEAAAIKAVVRVEAGAAMEGFWAPGVPIINYDTSISKYCKPTRNVKAPASETIPPGIKSAYGRKEWGLLVAARKKNLDKANMTCFWGMFQIGGFNYKICGCESVQEFVDRMSYSEFEQLQLFANFITNSGMLPSLKQKNWAAFAKRYNGSSYAKRGYHTKMASYYAKFKKEGL